MFEMPGMGVRDIDGVEASSQRRVDIGTRRIADHPCLLWVDLQFCDDAMIRSDIFFWNNYHLPEALLDSGTFDFEFLFFEVSLCKQDKVVSSRQIVEGLFDSVK